MKTAQRPRRSEDRGPSTSSWANGVGEDAGHPTVASTSRKGMRGPHHEGT